MYDEWDYDGRESESDRILKGLIWLTKVRGTDIAPEEIISLATTATTFPDLILGAGHTLSEAEYRWLARVFIDSDDYKKARDDSTA